MVMNGIYLVVLSALVLILGYRFYGAWLAAKVLTVNQYRTTPAVEVDDGIDYVPTNKWVTFVQHFAAIAGAGPLVGPVIAAQFGYLPGVLWILIGSVLAVVANSLENSPWGFFTVSMTIPIAIFVGLYLQYIQPGKIGEVTIIGMALIFAAITYGLNVAASSFASWFTWGREDILLMLAVYSFFAAALPVWLLMAPRGYLSTYMKIGTIGALAVGIICVMPVIQMPAVSAYVWGGGPVLSGSAIPYVFITIASAALSGFHATVSTGTTSKMIVNEREMMPIGYGGMLTEAFIAMMALIAATSLNPNDYFAINSSAQSFANLGISPVELPHLSQIIGEDLMHRPGGAVSLAVGMSHIFSQIPFLENLMGYLYHFCIMFEALFIMTLIDSGTRVCRYMLQELFAYVSPKMGDQHWLPGVYICSAIVAFTWGYLVLQGDIGTIWTLFGVSNQLLATMGLAIGTTIIMHLGRKHYAWTTGVPFVFIAAMTIYADYLNVFDSYIPEGKYSLAIISFIMFILVFIVVVEAVRSWIRFDKLDQDYRDESQVEADYQKSLS